jgi:hypothetical protein
VFTELTAFPGSGITTTEARGLIRRQADPAAPAHRVTGLLLAATADAAERALAATTWRDGNRGAADWLTLLVAHTGYQLADIEVVAMQATDPAWAPPAAAATAPPAAARRTRAAPPAAAGR